MANNLVNPNTNFLDPNHWKTLAPAAKTNFLSGIAAQNDTSGESKYFKGLTVNEENEIFAQCDRANVTQYERNLMANDLYKKKLAEKTSEKKNSDKAEGYMDLLQRAANATDQTQKNQLNGTARKHEVADMIRNYVLNANGEDLTDIDDEMLIHDFTEENPQSAFSIDQYVNSDMSQSYFSRMMGFSQADEEKEQSGFEQWLNGLGERFQAFGKGIDNLLSKGQASIDESGVDLNAYTRYIQDKYGVSYPAKLDKATRDKEYAAVKENPELLKPYMTSTADDVLDVAEGGVDIAFSTFNPYATAGFTAAGGLESLMGGGALTRFGEKMGGIGSVINELPGLSQFRDSLSEENQARFDQFVANSALGLMMGVKNKSNIYKNPKQFLVENLQPNQITKNFMENVVGISEKAYGGLQRAGNFARGIEGSNLGKMAGRMSGGLDGLSEWGAEKLTNTVSAQDKLYKAQEPRMNVLSNKKNLEKRRANSDRANQLIVENGYKPTNTAERLEAHQKTLDKLWGQVMERVNEGEGMFADQSSIISKLEEYINEQKSLGIDASKSDIQALERELASMKKQQKEGTLDIPTLEKKKQVFNDLIDWKGVEASEVYKKGIRLITHEIGKIEDAMLAEIPGEFQALKNDVGALLDTYEDVFKADMKNQRKKGNGLIESYSRIEGIGDTIAGLAQLFKGDISGVAKGLSKVALGKAMAKATDVDFLVKKGFEELSKSFEENQVSSKTATKIKTDQAVFDELSNYILEVNKDFSEEDILALGKMIDDNRENLSRQDYQLLKDALRDQTQNWDIEGQWDEWLKTEGKDIENGVDVKAVKDFQSRILKIENEEKNVGKVAGKKVNREYSDAQQRAVETKREKLIEEIGEYYGLDQYEAANKYDELRDSANVNNVKYQTAGDQLIGLHNLSIENLEKAKKLGGFPMPSIAITKRGVPHTSYGDISIIFKGDTIDPNVNKANKLYGVDAYTPTFPRIEAHPKSTPEARAIVDKIEKETGLSYGEVHQWLEYKDHYEDMYPELKKYSDEYDNLVDYKIFDGFTNTGKRRYLDYNLDNIVKYMKKQDGKSAFGNFGKLVGDQKGKLKSVEDARNLEFKETDKEAYRKLAGDYSDAMWDVFGRITDEDSFLDFDMFSSDIEDAFNKNDAKWLEKAKYLLGDYGDRLTIDDIKQIHKPIIEGSNIKRPYAEAKPERPVGFDEVGAVVVPEEQLAKAQELLKDTGVKVYGYKEGERMNVVDKVADENNLRFQKYGTAGEGEKGVNAIQGLNIRNFKNGKSVKELADNYGIKTHIVQSISTPEGQKAYGMYGNKVITLAKDLKESTVPHELLHATFDMVDQGKKNQILDGIKERLKVDDVQAEEWLADNFSEYYRTGKFDTKSIPTTFVGKVKQFFQQIKEYIDGTYANRKEIQNLFDDIIDGKLEGEYGAYSDPKFQSVWHGSRALFDKFDSSHMGEGEGAQAHGWGHYVTKEEGTGRHYAEFKTSIEKPYEYDGKSYKDMIIEKNSNTNYRESRKLSEIVSLIDEMEVSNGKSFDDVLYDRKKFINKVLENDKKNLESKPKGTDQDILDNLKMYIENDEDLLSILDEINADKVNKIELPKNKHLYNVEIPDPKKADTPTGSNYIEENGKLTLEQRKDLIKRLREINKDDNNYQLGVNYLENKLYGHQFMGDDTWRDVYEYFSEGLLDNPKKASKALEAIGYDGIHYFGGRDGECYVIFNDDALDINNREDY